MVLFHSDSLKGKKKKSTSDDGKNKSKNKTKGIRASIFPLSSRFPAPK